MEEKGKESSIPDYHNCIPQMHFHFKTQNLYSRSPPLKSSICGPNGPLAYSFKTWLISNSKKFYLA